MSEQTSQSFPVALGADHGGFNLKQIIKDDLISKGYQVNDVGTHNTEAVDYPQLARKVAEEVSSGRSRFGIMIDGAGIGSAMVANKLPGVRAALCYDLSTAGNAREHNDANVLTMGAGLIGSELAQQVARVFLTKECSVPRHQKRVDMINNLDSSSNSQKIVSTEDHIQLSNENLSTEDIQNIAQVVGELLQSDSTNISHAEQNTCKSDMICKCGVCLDKKPETIRQFLDMGVQRIGYHDSSGCECVPEDIAQCIDHTILKPATKSDDIKRICSEAKEYSFASVCVSPSYVKLAAKELAGSKVKVCTVVGFPSGAHTPEIKAMETRQAIRDGAEEIDMVINIGALKSGEDDLVYRDIRKVCEACEDGSAVSKVIIETPYLTEDEKVRACQLSKKAKANYVKTSTGFGPKGATIEDVALMSSIVRSSGIGVKAAGGISNYDDAKKMIDAGATRLGASAGIRILQESKSVTYSN